MSLTKQAIRSMFINITDDELETIHTLLTNLSAQALAATGNWDCQLRISGCIRENTTLVPEYADRTVLEVMSEVVGTIIVRQAEASRT